jgi:dihydroorotate dehydrogenase electron transfer subunit
MVRSKKVFSRVEIASNRNIPGSELMLLSFFEPSIALSAVAGQFVEIGIPGCILPKPFSIRNTHRFGLVDVMYEVVGKGTETLANMSEGAEITVLGPLGNGFIHQNESDVYLVGGGTGIAPILFLAETLDQSNHVSLFIGARSNRFLPELSLLPAHTKIATDDGSEGYHGNVIDLMRERLLPQAHVFACGPKPMLKSLWNLVKNWNNEIQFSLEAYMGCGIGACLGCQIETTGGQKHICTDGPVFYAKEVIDAL